MHTTAKSCHTSLPDSVAAGRDISRQIQETFADRAIDAVLVFASSSYDFNALLSTIKDNSI